MFLRFFIQHVFFLNQNALFKYTGEQTCEIFTGSPILPQHFFFESDSCETSGLLQAWTTTEAKRGTLCLG